MKPEQRMDFYRQLKGLSLDQVAVAIGRDQRTVRRWHDEMPKVVKDYISLVELYDKTPNDIFLNES
jgi:transcriptional regulator with XRE-family HTH domain